MRTALLRARDPATSIAQRTVDDVFVAKLNPETT